MSRTVKANVWYRDYLDTKLLAELMHGPRNSLTHEKYELKKDYETLVLRQILELLLEGITLPNGRTLILCKESKYNQRDTDIIGSTEQLPGASIDRICTAIHERTTEIISKTDTEKILNSITDIPADNSLINKLRLSSKKLLSMVLKCLDHSIVVFEKISYPYNVLFIYVKPILGFKINSESEFNRYSIYLNKNGGELYNDLSVVIEKSVNKQESGLGGVFNTSIRKSQLNSYSLISCCYKGLDNLADFDIYSAPATVPTDISSIKELYSSRNSGKYTLYDIEKLELSMSETEEINNYLDIINRDVCACSTEFFTLTKFLISLVYIFMIEATKSINFRIDNKTKFLLIKNMLEFLVVINEFSVNTFSDILLGTIAHLTYFGMIDNVLRCCIDASGIKWKDIFGSEQELTNQLKECYIQRYENLYGISVAEFSVFDLRTYFTIDEDLKILVDRMLKLLISWCQVFENKK